jgi:hypothetical protein
MAKKRIVYGSVLKSTKEGSTDYIKLRKDTADTLLTALKGANEKGLALSLESKTHRIESLNKAVDDGKVTVEKAEEIRGYIDKMPDFVRFEIVGYV